MISGNVGLTWRRFLADVLTGAAALTLAIAAAGGTSELLYFPLVSGLLVGIGLMLEPDGVRGPTLRRSASTHPSVA